MPLDVGAWVAFSYPSLIFHEGAWVLGHENEANQDLCPCLHNTRVDALAPFPTIHEVVEEGVSSSHGVEEVVPRDPDHHVGNEGPCGEGGHVGHAPFPLVVEDVLDHGA